MGAFRVEVTSRAAVPGIHAVFGRTGSEFGAKLRERLAIALAATHTLSQQLPNILVALLTPAALVALVMGLWRVGADLDWAGVFPITAGLFSHWQVWIGLSITLKMLSSSLLAWDIRTRKISEEN